MLGKNLINAAAGNAGAAEGAYIEDVFSTYLYTGNGSTQTITNGIDLDGEGGLVWIKWRSGASHAITDTERGAGLKLLFTDYIYGENYFNQEAVSSFLSNGFVASGTYNALDAPVASWTFRKAPKFFDVVTYTGTGSARTVSHNLGSVPGCIMVKRTDTSGDWQVYHRANTANPETDYLVLNSTAATADSNTRWNDTAPTDSVFTVGTEATVNASGGTYVAYLFAHDAGGFGDDGEQNVISCGSYTGNGSATGPAITLGYEPQWVMVKNVSESGYSWYITDSMRGFTLGNDAYLGANRADAEISADLIDPTSTGFQIKGTNGNYNNSGIPYIYIAIRRGPMKTPTSGTSVYGDLYALGEPSTSILTTENGVLADMVLHKPRMGGTFSGLLSSRLTGNNQYLVTTSTGAEIVGFNYMQFDNNEYAYIPIGGYANNSGGTTTPYVIYSFNRAPGFFDVVCYTGTGVARTVNHNLGVAPEMMIVKGRNQSSTNWAVYSKSIANSQTLYLNATNAASSGATYWNSTSPTDAVFTVGDNSDTNVNTYTYVAYLFASLEGISKVGSYTGTGTTLAIDCGFSAGARFVMIKRTDSTGDWYVWDSARGIVAGDDPYWLINSTADQVTNTDYVDTSAAGFEITSTAPAAINASGGTFIFLAIA